MALDLATAKFLEKMADGDGRPVHEGTPHEVRAFAAKIAELAGPAPEHRYPTAVDDSYVALVWVGKHLEDKIG